MNDDHPKGFDTLDLDLEELDDAPTDRIVPPDDPPQTDPTHAAVIDPGTADEIEREYAPTVQEDGRLTFVATVGPDGRLIVPRQILEGEGALEPGDELLIRAQKIE